MRCSKHLAHEMDWPRFRWFDSLGARLGAFSPQPSAASTSFTGKDFEGMAALLREWSGIILEEKPEARMSLERYVRILDSSAAAVGNLAVLLQIRCW